MFTYKAPLIVVEDIKRSRHFYEYVLGQKVKFDFIENVQFEGDFSIHLKTHFSTLLGGEMLYPIINKANNGELYFESEQIEEAVYRLEQAGVEFVHPMREQPWGQRVARVYDPDGHIIEVGETLEAVAVRFYQAGMGVEQICARLGMPVEFVTQAVDGLQPALKPLER
jgi:catechol 2,3-dioxygenase-like lactoylglutathione lyase family enzyme